MATKQIPDYLNELRTLLPDLRAGKITAIEFGDGTAMGFMSHHRIQFIHTAGGEQLCFRPVARMMFGSGYYMGQPDDRTIEIEAQRRIQEYTKETPISKKLKELRAQNPQLHERELKYFAIE
jgi:hypothetical protein